MGDCFEVLIISGDCTNAKWCGEQLHRYHCTICSTFHVLGWCGNVQVSASLDQSHYHTCPACVLQNLLQGAPPNKLSRERDKSLSISLSELPLGGNILSVRSGWDRALPSVLTVCIDMRVGGEFGVLVCCRGNQHFCLLSCRNFRHFC